MLTQCKLKKLLTYNKKTGDFYWKKRRIEDFSHCKNPLRMMNVWNSRNTKSPAGNISTLGYITIRIDKKLYYAHRLAFLYTEGYIPEHDVHHKNGKRSDNRWENLEHVTKSCHRKKDSISKNNTSGVTGVSKDSCGFWYSRIWHNNNKIYLGYFKTFDAAVKARYEAEQKYNYDGCQSISSAYLYLKEKGLL